MLILGRKSDQSIVFPTCGITIKILQLQGKGVKVGIEAPSSTPVLRGEICESGFAAFPTAAPTWDKLAVRDHLERLKSALERGEAGRVDALLEELLIELEKPVAVTTCPPQASGSSTFQHTNELDCSSSVSEACPGYDLGLQTSQSYHSAALRLLFLSNPIHPEFVNSWNDPGYGLEIGCVSTERIGADPYGAREWMRGADCLAIDLDCLGKHRFLDLLQAMQDNRKSGDMDAMPCILVLADFAPSAYGLSCSQSGVSGWLFKPFVMEHLQNHLVHALGLTSRVLQ